MAEFPAIPLWTDAYLADTRDLTASQHGAYMLLLMTAWRTKENGLPDDDDKLARWAAMDKRAWLKNKRVVMSFWCKIDGIWHQKRLDDERKRAEHVRKSQVQAGLASALKRKQTQSRHVATELPTPLQPPSPSPSTSTSNEVLNPPLSPFEEKEVKNERARKRTNLSDDWKPNEGHIARANGERIDIERESEKFRNYHLAKGTQSANWNASFTTWLINAVGFLKNETKRSPIRKVL